jgi:phosphatidylinositol-3-phosphatase
MKRGRRWDASRSLAAIRPYGNNQKGVSPSARRLVYDPVQQVRLPVLIAVPVALGSLVLAVWSVGTGASAVVRHSPKAARPCRGAVPPPRYSHVIWIVFENQGYAQLIGNHKLPYTNRLAAACGLATHYYGVGDPSLPNYIAMTSGGTWGVTGDFSPLLHVPSIFSQVRAAHLQWRSYSESMPRNCGQSDYPGRNPVYTAHHEPVIYYAGIRRDCARWDVPLGTVHKGALAQALAADTLPAFAIVGPNDDGGTAKHGCSRPCGNVDPPLSDSFLRAWMRTILASKAYASGTTAVFVTWDEDATSENTLCPALNCDHLATLVVSPSVLPGTRSNAVFSHYSLLRTTEDLLGLRGHLGKAASARSMASDFRLLRGGR